MQFDFFIVEKICNFFFLVKKIDKIDFFCEIDLDLMTSLSYKISAQVLWLLQLVDQSGKSTLAKSTSQLYTQLDT